MKQWVFKATGAIENGRITVRHEPERERCYAMGIDSAFGIEDGDLDAGVILDDLGRECAIVSGHWGEAFPDIVERYGVLDAYNPFLVVERTGHGLSMARRWYQAGKWVYFERDPAGRGERVLDKLGHAPRHMDPTVVLLREVLNRPQNAALGRGDLPNLDLHDMELLGQLSKFGFRPKSSTMAIEEARDIHLTWGAPPREHDDLVRALALAVAGIRWLPQFVPPKPKLPAGSIGAMLKYDSQTEKKKDVWGRS